MTALVGGQGNGADGRATGPSDPAATLRQSLTPHFETTFRRSIGEVLAEAIDGRFEDPGLAQRAALLRDRLAARQAQVGNQLIGGATGAPAATVTGGGAAAAPGDLEAMRRDERELLEVYAQQARARLDRVTSSLRQRFAAGSALPSAASGQLDIHNFKPRNEQEAQAFAERLAIDLTEGAARLEVYASELNLAQHEAATTGSNAAKARVTELEQQFARQQEFVLELAAVVDGVSNEAVSTSATAATDAELGKVIGAAVREGASIADVEKLKKLHAMVVDEAATGNSTLVNRVRADMTQVVMEIMRQQSIRDQERRREDERAADRKREDQRAYERLSEARQASDHAAARAQARRQEHLNAVIARYEQMRARQAS